MSSLSNVIRRLAADEAAAAQFEIEIAENAQLVEVARPLLKHVQMAAQIGPANQRADRGPTGSHPGRCPPLPAPAGHRCGPSRRRRRCRGQTPLGAAQRGQESRPGSACADTLPGQGVNRHKDRRGGAASRATHREAMVRCAMVCDSAGDGAPKTPACGPRNGGLTGTRGSRITSAPALRTGWPQRLAGEGVGRLFDIVKRKGCVGGGVTVKTRRRKRIVSYLVDHGR